MSFDRWTRRRFLAVSGGAAAAGLNVLAEAQSDGIPRDAAAAQAANAREAAAVMPPPGVITGGTRPLMEGMTARPLRYTPERGEFVIRNGKEFFNRPLYGVSSPTQSGDFRVDAGDLPEFSIYLPGHGGNLKLGFIAGTGAGSKWAADADEVVARYRPGRMIYEIRDALLGGGMLRAELLTTSIGQGFLLKVEGHGLPPGTRLAWAFGAVSGKKGKRNGDIGCESEPVSQFFQLRAEECEANKYVLQNGGWQGRSYVFVQSPTAEIELSIPARSECSINDFTAWASPPPFKLAPRAPGLPGSHPIVLGSAEFEQQPLYLTLDRVARAGSAPVIQDPAPLFAVRSAAVETIVTALTIDTPDEYVNAAGGAISIAAETIWDQKQQCVLHGGVAWRVALAGWRGPYCLDALGHHDRAKLQFRHWIARQNVTPVTTVDPAVGPWDKDMHLARKEGMLHSNGDLSNNHYDMNMVFFDVLLRHLMWTGDLDFAREIWPAFQRHLAWEHRLFRRTYKSPSGAELPLYEAYAAIWASDNLQYNGGGAAHSSAYMVFALRKAAQIATLLGEDGSPYAAEATLIEAAMMELLWVPDRGLFAESKDLLGPQTVYTNPAVWTVYHTWTPRSQTLAKPGRCAPSASRLSSPCRCTAPASYSLRAAPRGTCSPAPTGSLTSGASTSSCSPKTCTWRSPFGRRVCTNRHGGSSKATCSTRCTWVSAPETST